jgi:hypothetical protein
MVEEADVRSLGSCSRENRYKKHLHFHTPRVEELSTTSECGDECGVFARYRLL